MARVISFYVPVSYRLKPRKDALTTERGRVIRFTPRHRTRLESTLPLPVKPTPLTPGSILRRLAPFVGS